MNLSEHNSIDWAINFAFDIMFTSGTLIIEPEEVAHSFQLTLPCYLSLENVVYHFNKTLCAFCDVFQESTKKDTK